jgi:site-specific recombinase XerD
VSIDVVVHHNTLWTSCPRNGIQEVRSSILLGSIKLTHKGLIAFKPNRKRRFERMGPLFLDQPFEQFCKEKEYVKNSSPNTLLFYQYSYKKFKLVLNEDIDLTKSHLTRFVLGMRELGVKPETCNVYCRGMNSFLSWLFENEYTPEHLKIKYLKTEQRVMRTFTEFRLHGLLCLVLDTGIRISEALDLRRDKVDFDNLLEAVS